MPLVINGSGLNSNLVPSEVEAALTFSCLLFSVQHLEVPIFILVDSLVRYKLLHYYLRHSVN